MTTYLDYTELAYRVAVGFVGDRDEASRLVEEAMQEAIMSSAPGEDACEAKRNLLTRLREIYLARFRNRAHRHQVCGCGSLHAFPSPSH